MADFYHDDPVDFEQPIKRKLSSVLGFIALIAGSVFLIQTTLAGKISLNSGAPIQFGQGVTQLTACSGSNLITAAPQSTFVNQSNGGAYYFSSVVVTDVPDSCQGYDFTLNAYGQTGDSPLALFNSTSAASVVYNNSGTFQLGVGAAGTSIVSATRRFTVTFTTPVALSTSIWRIALQNSKHTLTCAAGGAAGYTGGGKTDWFMPSKMELVALVTYESTFSVIDPIYGNTQFFNSSSEFSASNVWGELMHSSGSPASGVGKTDNNHYVSVRAF